MAAMGCGGPPRDCAPLGAAPPPPCRAAPPVAAGLRARAPLGGGLVHRMRAARAAPAPATASSGDGGTPSPPRPPPLPEAPPPPAAGRPPSALGDVLRGGAVGLLASAALLLAAPGALAPRAAANTTSQETAAIGLCLLRSCQGALAGCLADVQCAENLVCLQACNLAPDESACQVRCGDRYSDKAIDTFNSCAVSQKKCVPQRVDEGLYPVPPDCALDKAFDLSAFTGRWYITAGLNPLFDTFPCQEHYFAVPEPGRLFGKIRWRIPRGGRGDFLERQTDQRFVQDAANAARLYNRGNEYLNYKDDWFVLGSKRDAYVFIYYIGENDAWKGYGGATVYTRERSLPAEYVPELRAQAAAAGIDWDKMTLTDNTCGPRPPPAPLAAELGADLAAAERAAGRAAGALEADLAGGLRSFGRGFTVLESELAADARGLATELARDEAELEARAAAAIRRAEAEAAMSPAVQALLRALPEGLRAALVPAP